MTESCDIVVDQLGAFCRTCGAFWDPEAGETGPCDPGGAFGPDVPATGLAGVFEAIRPRGLVGMVVWTVLSTTVFTLGLAWALALAERGLAAAVAWIGG